MSHGFCPGQTPGPPVCSSHRSHLFTSHISRPPTIHKDLVKVLSRNPSRQYVNILTLLSAVCMASDAEAEDKAHMLIEVAVRVCLRGNQAGSRFRDWDSLLRARAMHHRNCECEFPRPF